MAKPIQKRPKNSGQDSGMKDRILHAALLLMAEKGLEKTSVNDIVRAVNVTKPVLYYYFKNKEDLCRQLVKSSVRAMNDTMSLPNHGRQTLPDALSALLDAAQRCFRNNPTAGQIVMKGLFASQDRAFYSLLSQIRDARRKAICAMLEKAAERGEMRKQHANDLSHMISALTLYFIANAHNTKYLDPGFAARAAKILMAGAQAGGAQ